MRAVVAVIDDHEAFRHALGRVLRNEGLEPVLFASAEDYLDAPAALVPLCLVLDVNLPGLSGLQLQQRLRRDREAPPIIVMTSDHSTDLREHAERNGCAAFLVKPFETSTLLAAIASIDASRSFSFGESRNRCYAR